MNEPQENMTKNASIEHVITQMSACTSTHNVYNSYAHMPQPDLHIPQPEATVLREEAHVPREEAAASSAYVGVDSSLGEESRGVSGELLARKERKQAES